MSVNRRRADIAWAEEFPTRMAVIRIGLIETSIDTFESLVLSEDWDAEQAPRNFTQRIINESKV
jgi:hypothetical protein